MTASKWRPHRFSPYLALFVAVAILVLAVGTARAAVVTVGSPLSGPFVPNEFRYEPTWFNAALEEPGAIAASPVNGLIVRWRMLDGHDGQLRLRVLRPGAGGLFTGAGTGAPAFPLGPGLEIFPASLPIEAGDFVGLEFSEEADLGYKPVLKPDGAFLLKAPIGDGTTKLAEPAAVELAFNADILPAPAIASVKPNTGSFKGHTKVTIFGSDLSGASAVSFGGVPAAAFSVDSDGQITATSPRSAIGSTADIAVTTIAGTSAATSADRYTAAGCVVPHLSGKKFKAVKRKLRKADCGIGLVIRKGGVPLRSGRVTKQGPKPGKKLAPGAKVRITIS